MLLERESDRSIWERAFECALSHMGGTLPHGLACTTHQVWKGLSLTTTTNTVPGNLKPGRGRRSRVAVEKAVGDRSVECLSNR